MKRIWDSIRRKICPRRLYEYGTLGLWHHDDRTRCEKVFDRIDKFVNKINLYFKQPAYIRKQIFHSFFDISTQQTISSAKQIDDICKEKGLEYMSFREIRSEADRYKRINEEEKNRMIKKDISDIVANVKKGKRSYKKEIMDRIKQNKYTIKENQAFNEP